MKLTATNPRALTPILNGQYYDGVSPGDRMGIMLHYDASATDAGALAWFSDPRCRVSYNYLVLDDGSFALIAPLNAGAWHAGQCAPSDWWLAHADPYTSANRQFFGVAAATTDGVAATARQLLSVAWLCRHLFDVVGWDPSETWRIVGHSSEAVFDDGRRGRKKDPEGSDLLNPVLSVEDVRDLVEMMEMDVAI